MMLLAKIERYVLDDSEPAALRVFGWVKLLKTWASLRWSASYKAGRATADRRPASYRSAKDKELWSHQKGQGCRLRERAGLFRGSPLVRDWLRAAKGLANYKRDYLLPRLRDDMAGFDKKMAGYGDAMVATAAC